MQEFKEFLDKYKFIFLFVLGIVILYCRNAYNLKNPIMYAEDGVWFSDIMKNGLGWSIVNSRSDYFVLLLATMLKFADLIDIVVFSSNLKYVPYIITIISYTFITLVAILPFLTLGKRVNNYGKLFLYFGILLLPMGTTNTEILGRILQSHFYMWIITFCLLVYRFDNKDKRKILLIITDILLLCTIATFPSVLLLVLGYALIEMFYIIKRNFYDIKMKKNEKRFNFNKIKSVIKTEFKKFSTWSLFIFCLLVFILGIVLLIKMNHSTMNFETGGNVYNIVEFLVRGMCYIFIWPFYDNLNIVSGSIIIIITLIFYIINYFFIDKKSKKFYLICLFSFFLITITTLVSRFYLTYHLVHFTIRSVPDRYYILMNMTSLFPIAILVSDWIKNKKIIKKVSTFIILGYFILLNMIYHEQIFQFEKNYMVWLSGMSFEERLYESYINNNLNEEKNCYIVEIDPEWKMDVPIERMLKSVKS